MTGERRTLRPFSNRASVVYISFHSQDVVRNGIHMKILMTLAVLQTICIVALAARIIGLDHQIETLLATQSAAVSAPGSNPDGVAATANQPLSGLDEARLRRIVADEVRALINAIPDTDAPGDPEPDEPAVSPAEYRARLEHAMEQLDFFVARGEISPAEMASLQADVARLDTESRKHVLSLLARAINSGELDGHF
jgi:hypothetical protein